MCNVVLLDFGLAFSFIEVETPWFVFVVSVGSPSSNPRPLDAFVLLHSSTSAIDVLGLTKIANMAGFWAFVGLGLVLGPLGLGFVCTMAEIGCNWARIGPSKSSQSLSIAHKWAVVID
ncbi:hypothetical protein Tco_1295021 [Tanacetum coccineum]